MVVPSTESPCPDPNQPKLRRPISAAKYAACVANSKKSSGPKSDAGKAIAARNSTEH
jgi:hypothetical protein